jgi:hypothetical protein
VKPLVPALVLIVVAAGCGGDTSTKPKPTVDCSNVADTTVAATVSYQNDIRPLFAAEMNGGYGCADANCHGGVLINSNYSVETYAGLFEQGDEAKTLGICSIRPGDPAASYLYMKITNDSGIIGVSMPFEKPLMAPADREKVRTWILEGARNN